MRHNRISFSFFVLYCSESYPILKLIFRSLQKLSLILKCQSLVKKLKLGRKYRAEAQFYYNCVQNINWFEIPSWNNKCTFKNYLAL